MKSSCLSPWLARAALFAAVSGASGHGAAPAAKPNILFILADDLGYGDVGCYGAPDIKTPNLDRLAAEGLRFTDFYANGTVCSPTRAGLLTGRYQQKIGFERAVTYQEMGRGLPETGKTIAHALQAAGYATGLSGKWHLGYDHGRRPLQQGFDHFFGLLGGNHHYFRHMDRVGAHDLWLGNEPVKREGYSTDLFTADAIAFLERNHARPFFLYLSHPAPHFPWQGPADGAKVVEPKKPSWQQGDRATYAAMVERMDHGIGEVLRALDRLGLRDRTLVVFSSDNGGHTYSRNAPLRDFKGSLWEGGYRVPCIARWPGVLPAGATTAQVAITMDWTATWRRLAGVGADPMGEDGIDLLPLLTARRSSEARTLFWRRSRETGGRDILDGRTVRHGPWKLIEHVGVAPVLFNLEQDISETRDVIAQHPGLAADLRRRLDAWEAGLPAAPR